MSLSEHLRQLLTPHPARWKPMLAGLAAFAVGAGLAVALQPYHFVAMLMTVVALGAWIVGACAMVGYVRWFFASEVQQTRRNRRDDEGA